MFLLDVLLPSQRILGTMYRQLYLKVILFFPIIKKDTCMVFKINLVFFVLIQVVLLNRLERIFKACFPPVLVSEMRGEIPPLNLMLEVGRKPERTVENLSERYGIFSGIKTWRGRHLHFWGIFSETNCPVGQK